MDSKNILKTYIFAFFVLEIGLFGAEKTLFVDTSGKISYYYRNFIAMANSAGFKTKYKNFYSFISSPKFEKFKTVFFVIEDKQFLENLNNGLVKNGIESLKSFVNEGGKNLALFFPTDTKVEKINEFTNLIGINQNQELKPILDSFSATALRRDGFKGRLFGTTLIKKTSEIDFESKNFNHKHYDVLFRKNIKEEEKDKVEPIAITLPLKRDLSKVVQIIFPLGLCFKDEKLKNIYLIANLADYMFCDIVENFRSNPIDFAIRDERLKASLLVLKDFNNIVSKKSLSVNSNVINIDKVINKEDNSQVINKKLINKEELLEKKIGLPTKITKEFILSEKNKYDKKVRERLAGSTKYSWIFENQLLCGFSDPGDFFMTEAAPVLKDTPATENNGKDNSANTGENTGVNNSENSGKSENIGKIENQDKKAEGPVVRSPMERGMDFIYDSGINIAWFEFGPEGYLSKLSKADPNLIVGNIKRMYGQMKKVFDEKNNFKDNEKSGLFMPKRQLPKFFIGTNITTNYRSNPVNATTKDFFGKEYTKVPCPLDFDNFWKPELIDVFDSLIQKLSGKDESGKNNETLENNEVLEKNETLKNNENIKIDGILLDFEMYHAQDQASDYTDYMDFSDYTWQLYAKKAKNNALLEYKTVEERTKYLAKNKLFNDYFNFLISEARSIGMKIKKFFNQKLPNAIIAAYAPTLPSSWFYRGMLAGLSSEKEPVLFLTFGTDFYSHADWLEKQGIYLIHGSVILLSKFEKSEDTKLINDMLKYQNFVWLNRISRMVHPVDKRSGQWWELEVSKMPTEDLAKEIRKAIENKGKKN